MRIVMLEAALVASVASSRRKPLLDEVLTGVAISVANCGSDAGTRTLVSGVTTPVSDAHIMLA